MDSNAALAQLQATQAAAQNPQDIFKAQQQQYGVQGAKDTVTGLRGAIDSTTKLLKSVAPSVMGRTANSLVTSAQAGRQIQNESAPIQEKLTGQGEQYNRASEDYQDLSGQADKAAGLAYQGQQDKLSYLQNIYNSLFSREQQAQNVAQQNWENQFRLMQNEQSLKAKASSGGGGGSSGGSSGGSKPPASYQQRAGGGFNFQKADGGAISARRYAQITGTNFNTLLKQMAASGDSGAADVLKNGASSKAYKALTWD